MTSAARDRRLRTFLEREILGRVPADQLGRAPDRAERERILGHEIHWREAIDAFRRYAKGLHPAALSFGDSMTYAVAHLAGEPLLSTGDDFAKTDLDERSTPGA